MSSKKCDNKGFTPDGEEMEGHAYNEESGRPSDNVADESFGESDNLSQVADEAEQWQDKYIRLSAEFDNYRKRTLKEKLEIIAAGGEDVIKSILGTLDDFDRAIAAAGSTTDVEAVREGVVLIKQKLMEELGRKGLSEIEAIGEPMDTDLFEAVAKCPVPDDQKGKIIDVVQKGYKLKDKVIRFAKVVVGE